MGQDEGGQVWEVADLTNEGVWGNGEPLTTITDTNGKEVQVSIVTAFKNVKWDNLINACIICDVPLEPETLIIHTEHGWVLPCRSCDMFVWYYEEDVWI